MAGGQERVLRRESAASGDEEDHEGHGAHRRVPDLACAEPHQCQPPLPGGMARIVVEAARADRRRGEAARHPEQVNSVVVLAIVADRGLSGAYNSSVLRATERLVDQLTAGGPPSGSSRSARRPGVPALPRLRGRAVLHWLQRPARVLRRPCRRRRRRRPFVAGEVDQSARVHRYYSREPERRHRAAPAAARPQRGKSEEGDESPNQEKPGSRLHRIRARGRAPAGRARPRAVESEVFSALLEAAAAFHTAQQRPWRPPRRMRRTGAHAVSDHEPAARRNTTEIMEIVGGPKRSARERSLSRQ